MVDNQVMVACCWYKTMDNYSQTTADTAAHGYWKRPCTKVVANGREETYFTQEFILTFSSSEEKII